MQRCSSLLAVLLLIACQAPTPQGEVSIDPEPIPLPATEGRVLSSDGVPIVYSIEGEGSVAIVLIHGWACDRSYWRAQVEPLIDKFKVIRLDLAGHGSSGTERAEWTLPAFGEDVKAVSEALDLERVILVGHSMGAPVALEATQLLGDRILGVVAVDALHDVQRKQDPEQWSQLMESYEADFGGTCGQFVHSMFLETADPDLVESTVLDMCDGPADISTALMAQFADYDLVAALAATQVPVRAINSAVFPTNVEGNRTIHPDFDAVIMEGVGHFPMLVQPEELTHHLHTVITELTTS